MHAGGDHEPYVLSWRGFDNSVYYMVDTDQHTQMLNYSGCGNTISGNHPVTKQMIIDSCRRCALPDLSLRLDLPIWPKLYALEHITICDSGCSQGTCQSKAYACLCQMPLVWHDVCHAGQLLSTANQLQLHIGCARFKLEIACPRNCHERVPISTAAGCFDVLNH